MQCFSILKATVVAVAFNVAIIGASSDDSESTALNYDYNAFALAHGPFVCTPGDNAVTVTVTPTVTHTITAQNTFIDFSSSFQAFQYPLGGTLTTTTIEKMVTATETVELVTPAAAAIPVVTDSIDQPEGEPDISPPYDPCLHLTDIFGHSPPCVNEKAKSVSPGSDGKKTLTYTLKHNTRTTEPFTTESSTVNESLEPDQAQTGTPTALDPCHLTDVNGNSPVCVSEKAKSVSPGPDGKRTVTYTVKRNTRTTDPGIALTTEKSTVNTSPEPDQAHPGTSTALDPCHLTDVNGNSPACVGEKAKSVSPGPDGRKTVTYTVKRNTPSIPATRTVVSYRTVTVYPVPMDPDGRDSSTPITSSTTAASSTTTASSTTMASTSSSMTTASTSSSMTTGSNAPAMRTPSQKLSLGPGGWNGTMTTPVVPSPLSEWKPKSTGTAPSQPSRAAPTTARMPWA